MALIQNGPLCEVHRRATFTLPDGMPLVWWGRLMGTRVSRCAGPDLMREMFEHPQYRNLRHVLFGGQNGVAEKLRANFPNTNIVNTITPQQYSERPGTDFDAIEKIKTAKPDIVWIGLSSPKQDYWMLDNYKHLNCTLVGVGAAFDFLAGTKKRAPKWMQKIGLEWVFRLLTEPKRLGPRYVKSLSKFAVLICRQTFRYISRLVWNRMKTF
jgi:N-acetylglucosaminyldiphosphoundecaprenol N-acetyl-beta-D-mannosaminyltransferase